MPFVETGDQKCSQHRDRRPAESPSRATVGRQGFPPGAEQKNAQQTVAEDMSTLAQEKVQRFEAGVVDAEQRVEQRVEKAAGVVRREIGGGLNRNNDQPQEQKDPG